MSRKLLDHSALSHSASALIVTALAGSFSLLAGSFSLFAGSAAAQSANVTGIALGAKVAAVQAEQHRLENPIEFALQRRSAESLNFSSAKAGQLLGLSGTVGLETTTDSLIREVTFTVAGATRDQFTALSAQLGKQLKSTDLVEPENGADVQEWVVDGIRTELAMLDEHTLRLAVRKTDEK